MPDEGDQIDDDEFLYRRIPFKTGWYDPLKGPRPVQEAFKPHRENDPDGLSLSRAKSSRHPSFLDAERCAKSGPSPHGYYIALIRAGDLRTHDINIVASPIPDSDPGHVHLPQLKSANRDSNEVKSLAKLLADELTIEVLGPFRSSSGQPS